MKFIRCFHILTMGKRDTLFVYTDTYDVYVPPTCGIVLETFNIECFGLLPLDA